MKMDADNSKSKPANTTTQKRISHSSYRNAKMSDKGPRFTGSQRKSQGLKASETTNKKKHSKLPERAQEQSDPSPESFQQKKRNARQAISQNRRAITQQNFPLYCKRKGPKGFDD
jgi:ribosomal protein RSM22 (predicted rRNA methylase)